MPDPGTVNDPYRSYNFRLSLGQSRGECFFTECSGLGVDIAVIPYREGGVSHVTRQIPGHVTYLDVTLRYGVSDSDALWKWLEASVEGRVERDNITIQMLRADGEPGFLWNLLEAWPSKWRAAPLDALGQEIAIESLTLSYEELRRERA